jgi:hypothetical protein
VCALCAEYAYEMFVAKIENLTKSFSHLRRTRGDGNCFYRGFVFSYLEGLLLQNNTKECDRCGGGGRRANLLRGCSRRGVLRQARSIPSAGVPRALHSGHRTGTTESRCCGAAACLG